MDYSQTKLIELFKNGDVPGETNVPKHIQTFISNVFVFDAHVYKFYKNDNDAFNTSFRDISTKEKRFDFTTRDYHWNNAMSPHIYTELLGVTIKDGVQFVEPTENAEELVIKMNCVDLNDILFEKLMHNEITTEDASAIGKALGESLARVRTPLSQSFNFYEVFKQRIIDAKNWMSSVNDISEEDIQTCCDKLEKFRTEHKELFEDELSNEMTYCGDIHSHNALYAHGEFFLMDTFSPKDDWLIDYHALPAYRIATDMWGLTGDKELFDSCLEGYEQSSGRTLRRELDDFYVLYAMCIAAPYHYMLQQSDETKKEAALRLHKFIKQHI